MDALVADYKNNPLSLLTEGHSRVVVAAALLQAGLSIIESKPGLSGMGFELRLNGRSLSAINANLPTMSGGIPDLRVCDGPTNSALFVELKTRFSYGSQGAATSEGIEKDIKRVQRGSAHLFLLASSRTIYDRLSMDRFMYRMPSVGPIGFQETGWQTAAAGKLLARYVTAKAFGHDAVFLAVSVPA